MSFLFSPDFFKLSFNAISGSKLPARIMTYCTLTGCLLAGLLAGCATAPNKTVQQEDFGSSNVFTHSFPGSEQASCEAARRALLSQGYVISEMKTSFIKGRRKFQRDGDIHVEIEFSVVCAPDSKGSNSVTVFANAVRDLYSLKKSSNSASIGVGGIGSVSVPFGASDDSLVKVASETIPSGQFYARFFDLVERYLDDSSVTSETDIALNIDKKSIPSEPEAKAESGSERAIEKKME